MKGLKQFHDDEKGVSEVIGAILILTIIVAFMGVQQVYSVPVWNKEIEFAHFNSLYDDFHALKRIIQETPIYDQPRTAVLHTYIDYPSRMFLINPSRPSATITTHIDKQVMITYNGNVTENVISCTIRLEERYNYFPAPAFILEHGMIIGDTGFVNYTIDSPLMNNNSMDVLLVNCNSYLESTATLNLQVYPVRFYSAHVNNASISFSTDYPVLWSDYLNSTGSDWKLSGNIITVNYANSTRMRIISSSIR